MRNALLTTGGRAAVIVTAMTTTTITNTPRTHPDLDTTTALVTGGGRGIGRLVAGALARRGVAVGLVARSPDELAAAVQAIEAEGGIAAAATADVTDAQ